MIGSLRGRVLAAADEDAIIEVGGVGYRVTVPMSTRWALPPVGEDVFLWVHTYVREQAVSLYGFAGRDELELFEELLNVSGVGPRLALTVLSTYAPGEFRRIIADGDRRALTRIPGVGKKTAERLLFELKGKLASPDDAEGLALSDGPGADARADALEALMALGYARDEAAAALKKALQASEAAAGGSGGASAADGAAGQPAWDAAELVRRSLRYLASDRGR